MGALEMHKGTAKCPAYVREPLAFLCASSWSLPIARQEQVHLAFCPRRLAVLCKNSVLCSTTCIETYSSMIDVHAIRRRLAGRRPNFHSEAGCRFAFACELDRCPACARECAEHDGSCENHSCKALKCQCIHAGAQPAKDSIRSTCATTNVGQNIPAGVLGSA